MFNRQEFFDWAYADLNSDSVRGVVAEFIVCRLLSCTNETRVEWDAFDLLGPGEKRIEIKASGYLQSWAQTKPSIPTFGIASKQSWYAETNTYSDEAIRPADVYVFCLISVLDRAKLNPLDPSQWMFLVAATGEIGAKFNEQKSVRWTRLVAVFGSPVGVDELRQCYETLLARC